MFLTKVKTTAAILLMVSLITGVAAATHRVLAAHEVGHQSALDVEPQTAQVPAAQRADRAKDDARQTIEVSGRVSVGRNVQVSTPYPTHSHHETVVAADPLKANRLFAFAMYHPTNPPSIVGYFSEDGGKSWQTCFDRRSGPGKPTLHDPSLAFGPDGTLYLVYLAEEATKPSGKTNSLVFYRCADGRTKWEALSTVKHDNAIPPPDPGLTWQRWADRPWLAVDGTPGKNRGRLYCASWLWLDVSADQGRSFTAVSQLQRKGYADYAPANPVVLSDGSLLVGRRLCLNKPNALPGADVLFSDDGGATLRHGPLIGKDRPDPHASFGMDFRFMPQLAADTSDTAYRDRVYAVWEDGRREPDPKPGQPLRPGQVRVLFSFSKDKGKSWSDPMVLSEQPSDGKDDYAAYMPSLAVNKAGIVAVTWYDRRGLPAGAGPRPPFYPPGCNVRMRVSLDGGETWPPSVQVNEKTIKASVWELRDTAGVASDAEEAFHPVWIDDRTGTTQVWTARVKIQNP